MSASLSRSLATTLVLVLLACSTAYLLIFSWAYYEKLRSGLERAALDAHHLIASGIDHLQPGASDEVGQRLAAAVSTGAISRAVVMDHNGVIRYASDTALVGLDCQSLGACAKAGGQIVQMMDGEQGGRVIRVSSPIGMGILSTDYNASRLKPNAVWGILLMTLAGGTVMLIALFSIRYALGQAVLNPIQQLNAIAQAFAGGDFSARANLVVGDEIGMLGFHFDDMADRIGEMVGSLRSNEDFLQGVIDAVPDGIRVIGPDYRILKVNNAYCRQLGVTPEEVVGYPCHMSSHHLPAPCSATLVTCPVHELADGRRATVKCAHRHLRKDGTPLFVEVSAAAISNEADPSKNCIIESIRDLNEQADMAHHYRLSEIGHLATGIAHEIHNPLWSIHLALQAIHQALDNGQKAADVLVHIMTADEEISRCLSVTNRLLTLSQPASGETVLVDTGAVIQSVVSLLAFEAELAEVSISLDLPPGLRTLAEESDISIIVLNLSQNAIHAMPDGGTLSISARRDKGEIVINFTDTGTGISVENQARIFWPFWSKRADGTHGTGLGLSIVDKTLNSLGGRITVISTTGKGSTFTIYLPDADAEFA